MKRRSFFQGLAGLVCGCLGLVRRTEGRVPEKPDVDDRPQWQPGFRAEQAMRELRRALEGVPDEDIMLNTEPGADAEILPPGMWGYSLNGTETFVVEIRGGAKNRSCSVCEASEAPLTGFVGPPPEHVHDTDYPCGAALKVNWRKRVEGRRYV